MISRKTYSVIALSLSFLVAKVAAVEPASSLSEETLIQIKFDQKLGQQISRELAFRDETGKPVRMGDYFGRKPVVLVLGYYECPMLCKVMNNGLIECLQDLKASAGADFEIVNVSIDSREIPQLAAAKKSTYLKRYGRHGAESGWHFLTGEEAAIQQLAREVGFHFAYDARTKEFAHPSGLIVLTPQGKVSRYLFGVTYSAKELSEALDEAGANKSGSPIQQFVLLCFHYSPLTGKYGNLVMMLVRVCGVVTMLVLFWFVFLRGKNRQVTLPVVAKEKEAS